MIGCGKSISCCFPRAAFPLRDPQKTRTAVCRRSQTPPLRPQHAKGKDTTTQCCCWAQREIGAARLLSPPRAPHTQKRSPRDRDLSPHGPSLSAHITARIGTETNARPWPIRAAQPHPTFMETVHRTGVDASPPARSPCNGTPRDSSMARSMWRSERRASGSAAMLTARSAS